MRSILAALILSTVVAAQDSAAPKTADKKPETRAAKQVKKPAAPKLVYKGYDLIHQGKIGEAIQLFEKLEEQLPGNRWSSRAMRPLKQAVRLEKILGRKEHPKWASAADWLYRFYSKNKVPTSLLELCKAASVRFDGNEKWTLRLAQSQMNLQRNEDALATYRALLEKADLPSYHALIAVLLARMDDVDAAKKELAAIPRTAQGSSLYYNIACAYAVMGEEKRAASKLRRAFELTPPSELLALKKQAFADGDFLGLRKSKVFKAAFQTISLVPEKAAVKDECKTCPSKGSCSEEEKKDCADDKDKVETKK